MFRSYLVATVFVACMTTRAFAGEFNANTAHRELIDGFNKRQWDTVKSIFTGDSVFHRANGDQVFKGPGAIVGRFSSTIGASDKWNVKLARLDSKSQLVGKDGRVVERGDFAVTAGGDDSSCYAGSYMMTWVPQAGGKWGLQLFAWQDVETDIAKCK